MRTSAGTSLHNNFLLLCGLDPSRHAYTSNNNTYVPRQGFELIKQSRVVQRQDSMTSGDPAESILVKDRTGGTELFVQGKNELIACIGDQYCLTVREQNL